MTTLIENATLITPFEELCDSALLFDDQGQIVSIGETPASLSGKIMRIDAGGRYLIPGLIDMHVHGGFGVSFGLGDLAVDLEKYATWAAGNAETGFLLSLTGPHADFIEKTISAYAGLLSGVFPGAQPLGLHLEGPFLNPERHGAYNPAWIRLPSREETQRYLDAGRGWIKHVTLAPELPGAPEVARMLADAGVIPALGHSNTDFETASAALRGDYSHVTHAFNAQSPLNHRQPGVVGALLASERVTAELIADGRHVHPATMRILLRCLGADRLVLITDAMPGAGMPDGDYDLLGQKVAVRGGFATLPDGTIGGSTAALNGCVRNMIRLAGASFKEAVQMASFNPARVLGLDDRLGSLQPGKSADLALVDADLNVFMTFVKGKLVYSK
ncbi:MAG: N-acetylglucosamine-6-phosphate deacetylase [Anaerolineae bacterium]|nr:N-acetylglucosamine-6-phosphate deacetylase [Anaerolineae bacterium]